MSDIDKRVAALAFARATDAFSNSFLIVVLPLFLAGDAVDGHLLGLPEAATIGVVLATLGFVNSGLQPFAGRLSDRLGRRKALVLAGLCLLALANLAYIWTDSVRQVLAVSVLQGLALALTVPSTLALISELSTATSRAESVGLFETVRLIGYGVGPVVAGAVVAAGPYRSPLAGMALTVSGYHAAFGLASLAALVGAGIVTLLVSDPDDLQRSAGHARSLDVRDDDGQLDPVFALATITLSVAVAISLIASLENQINARLGQSPAWFGMQFSVFLVPHILLQVPVGRLSDRIGRRSFVLWGAALVVPATLAQGYVTTPWEMLGARALQGLATALFFAPGLAMAGDLAEDGTTGSSVSVVTAAYGFGVAAGPLLSGMLVGLGFAVPFAVGAGLVAACTAVAAFRVDESHETDDVSTTPASG